MDGGNTRSFRQYVPNIVCHQIFRLTLGESYSISMVLASHMVARSCCLCSSTGNYPNKKSAPSFKAADFLGF